MARSLRGYYCYHYDFTPIIDFMSKYPPNFVWMGNYYFNYFPFIASKADLHKVLDARTVGTIPILPSSYIQSFNKDIEELGDIWTSHVKFIDFIECLRTVILISPDPELPPLIKPWLKDTLDPTHILRPDAPEHTPTKLFLRNHKSSLEILKQLNFKRFVLGITP